MTSQLCSRVTALPISMAGSHAAALPASMAKNSASHQA